MTTEAPAPEASPPAPAPAPAGEWYSTFTDAAVKDHATVKAWATPEDAVRSNLHLEKLVGVPQDQILKLPKSDAKPEDWAPVYDRLGRPKTPAEYKLETAAGADPKYAEAISKAMHENGMSLAQAQAVFKANSEYVASVLANEEEASKAAAVQDLALMKAEQGAAYEKYLARGKQAVQAFGLSAETVDALQDVMGLKATMDFLHTVGSRLGEDTFVASSGGGAFNGALNPAQAQARINALKGDAAFTKKYLEGDLGARQEMERLHTMAVAG